MKTPREILLQRHRAASPKLDAVRREVVGSLAANLHAASSRTTEVPANRLHPGLFLRQVWREIILPSRRIWGGLAAAWLMILFLNVSSSEPQAGRSSIQMAKSAPQVLMEVKRHRRLLAELLAEKVEQPADRRPYVPQPRSEGSVIFKTA
jgi:hypothetical protein